MVNTFQGGAESWNNSPLLGIGQGLQLGAANQAQGFYDAAQNYGMPPEALYQSYMDSMGQYAGGFNNLFNAASNNPYALEQMGLGRQLLGSQPQSYDAIRDERLALMREKAAPYEERASNALLGKMYGMGRMGSTGGGRDIQAFGRGLGEADTGRQLDAMSLADSLYGRDLNAAIARQGMGANLFSGGVGNYLQGLGQAGQFGQLGMGAVGGMFDAGIGWNELGYNRANDRLNRTSQMFGFGTGVQNMPLDQQMRYMNSLSGLTAEQQKQVEMSVAMAGGGQAQGGSPLGSAAGAFLGGLGQSMMTNPNGFFGFDRPAATNTYYPPSGWDSPSYNVGPAQTSPFAPGSWDSINAGGGG